MIISQDVEQEINPECPTSQKFGGSTSVTNLMSACNWSSVLNLLLEQRLHLHKFNVIDNVTSLWANPYFAVFHQTYLFHAPTFKRKSWASDLFLAKPAAGDSRP